MNSPSSYQIGSSGERIVKTLLKDAGFVILVNDKDNPDFDIIARKEDLVVTFEVKYDMMSGKTQNIAIEFFNDSLGKPSGVLATKADFWCIVIPGPRLYISTVNDLKKFLSNTEPKKMVTKAGDGNASLMLYPKATTLCHFTRITGAINLESFIHSAIEAY